MAKPYAHTQIGYQMLILLSAGIFFVTFWMVFQGFSWIAFIMLVVLDVALILFSTLTVEITHDTLEITFGPGMIHKRFNLRDVRECLPVTNPFWYGWGIRWIPGGWLYTVSGKHAVDLTMSNGRHYRIGTDVPQDLLKAIQEAIAVQSFKGDVAELHPS